MEMLPSARTLVGQLAMVFPCTPACRSWTRLLLGEIPNPWPRMLHCHQPHRKGRSRSAANAIPQHFIYLAA